MINDPIAYAVSAISRRGIDSTILELVYSGIHANGMKKNVASEMDRVLLDMCDDFSLISGDTMNIELSKCRRLGSEGYIYYIPPEIRSNRSVRNVLSVHSSMISGSSVALTGMSTGSGIASGIASMSAAISNSSSGVCTDVELKDSNTFQIITNNIVIGGYKYVEIEVENRERLKNLSKGSYPKFYKIALAYMKSVIYADRLRIRKIPMFGGHDISDIESTINEYSGASDEYDEYLSTDVGKMLMFADKTKTARYVNDLV